MDFSWVEKVKNARIVAHNDTDGVICAMLMYYVLNNPNIEIVVTDYNEIDAKDDSDNKFWFQKNDIVVDLPQPNIDVLFCVDKMFLK